VISPSDPSSAWTAKANKRVPFGYGLNYLIDLKHAVIVDVETTSARTYDEVAATRTMIERTRRRFDLSPKRLVAVRFLAFVTAPPSSRTFPCGTLASETTARSRGLSSDSTASGTSTSVRQARR
jgi:hypothetical protein